MTYLNRIDPGLSADPMCLVATRHDNGWPPHHVHEVEKVEGTTYAIDLRRICSLKIPGKRVPPDAAIPFETGSAEEPQLVSRSRIIIRPREVLRSEGASAGVAEDNQYLGGGAGTAGVDIRYGASSFLTDSRDQRPDRGVSFFSHSAARWIRRLQAARIESIPENYHTRLAVLTVAPESRDLFRKEWIRLAGPLKPTPPHQSCSWPESSRSDVAGARGLGGSSPRSRASISWRSCLYSCSPRRLRACRWHSRQDSSGVWASCQS